MRPAGWAILASLAMAVAPGARAAVSVFGGGMAEACSKATVAGDSDAASEGLCTNALDDEVLPPRDRAGTYINRGIMKLRRGDFEAAHADFDAGIKLDPTMGEAWVNRGAMWVGEKHYQDGLDDLDKGLALGVTEPEKAYFNRALAYEGLDNEKAAYFDYLKAESLKPDWVLPKKELLRFHVSRAPAS